MTERFGFDPITIVEAFEPPGRRSADRQRSSFVAPTSSRFAHIRPLDGLRGVAVLAVVVYHFSPSLAPGGFLGVDVFFVLSGFLITSLLVSEYGVATKISLRSFWIRRARRYVGVLDSGVFLRDRNGVYQWRMPRLPLGEIGCGSTGTVGVRWAGDGGRHFCADPSWDGSHCQAEFAAGERRLAAALAQQIFERFGT